MKEPLSCSGAVCAHRSALAIQQAADSGHHSPTTGPLSPTHAPLSPRRAADTTGVQGGVAGAGGDSLNSLEGLYADKVTLHTVSSRCGT